jgi:hypothetical protein
MNESIDDSSTDGSRFEAVRIARKVSEITTPLQKEFRAFFAHLDNAIHAFDKEQDRIVCSVGETDDLPLEIVAEDWHSYDSPNKCGDCVNEVLKLEAQK